MWKALVILLAVMFMLGIACMVGAHTLNGDSEE
jgi:hypothetical protein